VKLRITIITVILVAAGIATFTWATGSSNCCFIVPGPAQITGNKTVVAANADGPGGTFVSPETETSVISCLNSSSNGGAPKPCSTQNQPNNVVTATGDGKNVGGNFILCDPTFAVTRFTQTIFEKTGTSFTVSGTSCLPNPQHAFALSVCGFVSCPAGGFPEPPPGASPIILDLNGKGFVLTSAQNGVMFDISGTGHSVQMGWIAQGADNAFLALPGGDGLVHNGKQLFGDFTPQPPSDTPNGFAALAVYDEPKNGGNGDGIIDFRDAIFSSLRLWIDENHDGVSQPGELHTLPSLGVNSISLKYQLSTRTDQYGNVFRFKSKVNPDDPDASRVDRTAYDVFFVVVGDAASAAKSACRVPAAGR
jgi:hypothetical protein